MTSAELREEIKLLGIRSFGRGAGSGPGSLDYHLSLVLTSIADRLDTLELDIAILLHDARRDP